MYENYKGYDDLAKAIVEQAVVDYKDCMKKLWGLYKAMDDCKAELSGLQAFFNSKSFSSYCDIPASVVCSSAILTARDEYRYRDRVVIKTIVRPRKKYKKKNT